VCSVQLTALPAAVVGASPRAARGPVTMRTALVDVAKRERREETVQGGVDDAIHGAMGGGVLRGGARQAG